MNSKSISLVSSVELRYKEFEWMISPFAKRFIIFLSSVFNFCISLFDIIYVYVFVPDNKFLDELANLAR